MADARRGFEVGEVLHALVFQLSVADVSFLPLEELGDKPTRQDDGLGDLALQERHAHWMTEPYLCASLQKSMAASPCRLEREERIARSSLTFVLRTQAPASWVEATNSVCKAEWRACQPP